MATDEDISTDEKGSIIDGYSVGGGCDAYAMDTTPKPGNPSGGRLRSKCKISTSWNPIDNYVAVKVGTIEEIIEVGSVQDRIVNTCRQIPYIKTRVMANKVIPYCSGLNMPEGGRDCMCGVPSQLKRSSLRGPLHLHHAQMKFGCALEQCPFFCWGHPVYADDLEKYKTAKEARAFIEGNLAATDALTGSDAYPCNHLKLEVSKAGGGKGGTKRPHGGGGGSFRDRMRPKTGGGAASSKAPMFPSKRR